jgi:hypothetical protein
MHPGSSQEWLQRFHVNVQQPHVWAVLQSARFVVSNIQLVVHAVSLSEKQRDKFEPLEWSGVSLGVAEEDDAFFLFLPKYLAMMSKNVCCD